MEEYIHLFNTTADFESAYNSSTYKEPFVGYVLETQSVKYNKDYDYYKSIPLTFKIIEPGTILWSTSNSSYAPTIEYKLNNGNWTNITASTNGTIINTNAGDILQFRGDEDRYGNGTISAGFGESTAKFEVEGNIMSLINSSDFMTITALSNTWTFYRLFQYCRKLISAKNLILPATMLTDGCYSNMFQKCIALVNAPELPATTLKQYCYAYMFDNCTSLPKTPELHATILAKYCYYDMFSNCTSLTTVPSILPATTLVDHCYYQMFQNCTSLTAAPSTLSATTLADYCYAEMFANCASLAQAPSLPATTLVSNCYNGMFYNCTSLNYIKCLAIDISATSCTSNWVNGVAATGTFVKDPDSINWTIGADGVPTGWAVDGKTPTVLTVSMTGLKSSRSTFATCLLRTNSNANIYLASGTISCNINGTIYSSDNYINGKIKMDLGNLPASNYNVTFQYSGNALLEASENTQSFTVVNK